MATLRSAKQPRGPCGQTDKPRTEPGPLPVGASLLAMATLRFAKHPRGPCGQTDKARPEPAPLTCRSQLAGDVCLVMRSPGNEASTTALQVGLEVLAG